jgi:hypothetical protein
MRRRLCLESALLAAATPGRSHERPDRRCTRGGAGSPDALASRLLSGLERKFLGRPIVEHGRTWKSSYCRIRLCSASAQWSKRGQPADGFISSIATSWNTGKHYHTVECRRRVLARRVDISCLDVDSAGYRWRFVDLRSWSASISSSWCFYPASARGFRAPLAWTNFWTPSSSSRGFRLRIVSL